ncbi:MAG: hypothetical protein QOE66_3152 [Chloroflexota bacterium]|jgi:hypothetical protein|nr:hypothetical protein [Chloroflexota bacterium]
MASECATFSRESLLESVDELAQQDEEVRTVTTGREMLLDTVTHRAELPLTTDNATAGRGSDGRSMGYGRPGRSEVTTVQVQPRVSPDAASCATIGG